MSVVKSDGYGLGIVESAKAIDELTDWFGVATAEEAIEIRKAGVTKPILIFGYVSTRLIPEIVDNEITISTVSLEYIKKIRDLVPTNSQLNVHLKIDTGLNRVGLFSQTNQIEEYVEQAKEIYRMPEIHVTGIYTHFAVAGSSEKTDIDFTNRQFKLFQDVYTTLEDEGYEVGVRHCCNSDALTTNPEMYLDMVRTGKYLFGFGQNKQIEQLNLQLTFRLEARIIRIETIKAGDSVGYGRTFIAKQPTTIATVSFGFADGYRRNMGSSLEVLFKGQRASVAGRIAMDFMMIDVSKCEQPQVGDYVTLIGTSGDEVIMPNEISKLINGSTPEIMSQLNKRVSREYIGVKKTVLI